MSTLKEKWIRILEFLFQEQIKTYGLKVGDDLIFFLPENIIKLVAEGSYTRLVTPEKSFCISRKLSILEKELNGWGMIRIGRSHIINVCHVKYLVKGTATYIIMSDGSRIIIPRRKKVGSLVKIVTGI